MIGMRIWQCIEYLYIYIYCKHDFVWLRYYSISGCHVLGGKVQLRGLLSQELMPVLWYAHCHVL